MLQSMNPKHGTTGINNIACVGHIYTIAKIHQKSSALRASQYIIVNQINMYLANFSECEYSI